MNELRAPARILSASPAPAIVSETTHDLLVRWSTTAAAATTAAATTATTTTESGPREAEDRGRALMHLGQYVTTLRIRGAGIEEHAEFTNGREAPGRQIECIEAMVVAAERAGQYRETANMAAVGALLFVGGVVLALAGEPSSRVPPGLADRSAALFVRLARSVCETDIQFSADPRSAMLVVACAEVVPALGSFPRLRTHIDRLAHPRNSSSSSTSSSNGGVVGVVAHELLASIAAMRMSGSVSETAEKTAGLLCTLLRSSAVSLGSAQSVVQALHECAVDVLLEQERNRGTGWNRGNSNSGNADPQTAVALVLLHCVEAVLQRFFVEDAATQRRLPAESLRSVWMDAIGTVGCVHSATLALEEQHAGGCEVYRRVCTLAVQFITTNEEEVDSVVRQLFARNPCLAFVATADPVLLLSAARSCLVLFYLDLLEHLAPHLRAHTLAQLVVPLAARYAGAEALVSVGRRWFESAHALLLAVMEPPAAQRDLRSAGSRSVELKLELAPWYAALVLDLYPDRGITASLLRIAYAAAVRAAATTSSSNSSQRGQRVSWLLVERLLARLDEASGSAAPSDGEGSAVRAALDSVRRRDLLLVLADLLAAVPLELLPPLMHQLRTRLLADSDPAIRKAIDDEIQSVVMVKADVTRKFALSTWAWQLHADSSKL
ncbi:hypothetical protein GGI11_000272 [Coemansia sp. RSA 2049]|nr:hypothetical protein GGI11_000272 [Coemansia sp. RSA 2049]